MGTPKVADQDQTFWHLPQLQKAISSATAKMLTQQLRELESQKLIHREVYPVIPPKVEYSLTELGRSLIPVLVAMRDWGAGYMRSRDLETTCFMMKKNPLPQSN